MAIVTQIPTRGNGSAPVRDYTERYKQDSIVARIHAKARTLYAEQVKMPKGGSGKPGDLLSSDEVIGQLLEDERLRRVALTCVLPAVRCGVEWKYRRSDLEAWIARQRRDLAPANDVN